LQKSACQNLLTRAENGLNTTIGEGIKVSWRKQRLSIARATYENQDYYYLMKPMHPRLYY
jgi:ATP-binding cassette subfamily B protein